MSDPSHYGNVECAILSRKARLCGTSVSRKINDHLSVHRHTHRTLRELRSLGCFSFSLQSVVHTAPLRVKAGQWPLTLLTALLLRVRGYRGADDEPAPELADAVPRKRGDVSSRTGHHRAARKRGTRGGAPRPMRTTSAAAPCDRRAHTADAAAACGAYLSVSV